MPVTRDWLIVYNGFSVGGSTARQIQGEPRCTFDNNYETSTFEFDFITSASSDSAFATECLACENNFRVPRQDFTFTQAGQTLLSLKQSDSTGLDCSPSITKVGADVDNGRSRRYHVRLEFGRPADNISTNGLQFSTVNLDFDPSRIMTATISGIYTAISNTQALENYLAQITAFAAAQLSAIMTAVGQSGAVFEKVNEPQIEQNATNKYVNFTVVFRQINYQQSSSNTDQPEIVDPQLDISVERYSWDSSAASNFSVSGTQNGVSGNTGGGTTSSAGPLGNTTGGTNDVTQVMGTTGPGTQVAPANEKPWIINLIYSAAIDRTVTTTLVSEYSQTIRPFLIQEAINRSQGSNIVLLEDKPFYDPYKNKINVTMQFICYNNNLIEQHVTISDKTNFGQVLSGLWLSDPYAYYKWQGPAVKIRTVHEDFVAIDTYNGAVMTMIDTFAGSAQGDPGNSLGNQWTVLSREPKGSSIQRTIPGSPSSQWIANWSIETVLQYGNYQTPSTQQAGQVNNNNSVATTGH